MYRLKTRKMELLTRKKGIKKKQKRTIKEMDNERRHISKKKAHQFCKELKRIITVNDFL